MVLVVCALLVSLRRWIIWDMPLDHPAKYTEPLILWIPFGYVILYAWRERRNVNV